MGPAAAGEPLEEPQLQGPGPERSEQVWCSSKTAVASSKPCRSLGLTDSSPWQSLGGWTPGISIIKWLPGFVCPSVFPSKNVVQCAGDPIPLAEARWDGPGCLLNRSATSFPPMRNSRGDSEEHSRFLLARFSGQDDLDPGHDWTGLQDGCREGS